MSLPWRHMSSLEDYYESVTEPIMYACEECGKNFKENQDRCVDTCGGKVLPVYDRADYERD